MAKYKMQGLNLNGNKKNSVQLVGKGRGEYYNIFSFKVAHACCISAALHGNGATFGTK